jgi:hypothetical protein
MSSCCCHLPSTAFLASGTRRRRPYALDPDVWRRSIGFLPKCSPYRNDLLLETQVQNRCGAAYRGRSPKTAIVLVLITCSLK